MPPTEDSPQPVHPLPRLSRKELRQLVKEKVQDKEWMQALAAQLGSEDIQATPSNRAIAEFLGTSASTVTSVLEELFQESGFKLPEERIGRSGLVQSYPGRGKPKTKRRRKKSTS